MKVKFGEKLFQTKLLSRLAHEVCLLRYSTVLLRKLTNTKRDPSLGNILLREFHRCVSFSIATLSLTFILFQSLSSLNWLWPSNLWHSSFLCVCFQVVCISLEVWQRTHFTTQRHFRSSRPLLWRCVKYHPSTGRVHRGKQSIWNRSFIWANKNWRKVINNRDFRMPQGRRQRVKISNFLE